MFDKDAIKETLSQSLKINHIQILDESAKHKNHKGMSGNSGGHYTALIVSEDFKGLPLIKRHRMVNDALKKNFGKDIHALSIQALSLDEFQSKNS